LWYDPDIPVCRPMREVQKGKWYVDAVESFRVQKSG
jgi:hypothetical protein